MLCLFLCCCCCFAFRSCFFVQPLNVALEQRTFWRNSSGRPVGAKFKWSAQNCRPLANNSLVRFLSFFLLVCSLSSSLKLHSCSFLDSIAASLCVLLSLRFIRHLAFLFHLTHSLASSFASRHTNERKCVCSVCSVCASLDSGVRWDACAQAASVCACKLLLRLSCA